MVPSSATVPLAALADVRYMQIDTDAVMLFSDKNNEPLTSVDFVEENGINLNGDYENYFISGGKQRYMIVGRDLAGTDCRAILAVNESGYLFTGAGADSGHSVAADEFHLEAGGGAAQCYGAYPRRQSGGEG